MWKRNRGQDSLRKRQRGNRMTDRGEEHGKETEEESRKGRK